MAAEMLPVDGMPAVRMIVDVNKCKMRVSGIPGPLFDIIGKLLNE